MHLFYNELFYFDTEDNNVLDLGSNQLHLITMQLNQTNPQLIQFSPQMVQMKEVNNDKTTQYHVVVLKMFIAITACNILALGAVILLLLRITDEDFFVYMYYLNHINNPFIYLAFNKLFRNEVIAMVKNMCNRS